METTTNQPPSPPPSPPPLRPSSSASSLAAELFGDNDLQLSPAGILSSVFPPPTMTATKFCEFCSKPIHFRPLDSQVNRGFESGVMNVDGMSIFKDEIEPTSYCSSIFYGGQDDVSVLLSRDSKSYTKFPTKDDPKDDPNHLQSATRGNWWQAENVAKNTLNAITGVMNMDGMSIFQEEIEPSSYCSSIFYGGQDDVSLLLSRDSKSYTKFLTKDDPKDDPNHLQSATRGNWWQGNSWRVGSSLKFMLQM